VTKQLNDALRMYADKKALYFPPGTYLISDTVYVPAGSRLVGRVWSVLMATGDKFQDPKNPKAMIQVGRAGEKGSAQFSDFMISTQGPCPGAKLIEWNMADPVGQPGACGMWDVHYRIGGADGTNIQPDACPADDGSRSPASKCNGVWAMMHLTKTGTWRMYGDGQLIMISIRALNSMCTLPEASYVNRRDRFGCMVQLWSITICTSTTLSTLATFLWH